jgi:hypothetical protein
MNLCSLNTYIIDEIIKIIIDENIHNHQAFTELLSKKVVNGFNHLKSWTTVKCEPTNEELINFSRTNFNIHIYCILRLINKYFYKLLPNIVGLWKMIYPNSKIIYQTKKYVRFLDERSGAQLSTKNGKLHGIQKRGIFSLALNHHYDYKMVCTSEWYREHAHGGILYPVQRFKAGKSIIDHQLIVPLILSYRHTSNIYGYKINETWKWGRRIKAKAIRTECTCYGTRRCHCSNDGKIIRRKKRKSHGKNWIQNEIKISSI